MQTPQMNELQWKIAHNLAFDLVDWGTDANELGRVIAFLRRHQDDTDAKSRLMLLVQRLASSRSAPIRSSRTQEYYENILEVCEDYLYDISEPAELLLILGWSLRLMRYYRAEPTFAVEYEFEPAPKKPPIMPTEEEIVPAPPGKSEPPAPKKPPMPPPSRKEPESPQVKAGDKVSATVLKNNGIKVTVRLETDAREEVTFERPYYPGLVGAQVKVRVQGVDKGYRITKVIP